MLNYVTKRNNDEKILIHSGTKGMKWGVRRYQNEDGTLTEAGKKRYKAPTAEQIKNMRTDYGVTYAHTNKGRPVEIRAFNAASRFTGHMNPEYLKEHRNELNSNAGLVTAIDDINNDEWDLKEEDAKAFADKYGQVAADDMMKLFKETIDRERNIKRNIPASAWNQRVKAIHDTKGNVDLHYYNATHPDRKRITDLAGNVTTRTVRR